MGRRASKLSLTRPSYSTLFGGKRHNSVREVQKYAKVPQDFRKIFYFSRSRFWKKINCSMGSSMRVVWDKVQKVAIFSFFLITFVSNELLT